MDRCHSNKQKKRKKKQQQKKKNWKIGMEKKRKKQWYE